MTNDHPTYTTLDRFIATNARKAELEQDLTLVKAELETLQRTLLDEFADEGVKSKRDAKTGKLVYIARQIWARAAGDRVATAEALKQHGGELGEFARLDFNVNSLSSYFREQARARADDHDPVTDLSALVPEDLRDFIALTDDHALGVRAS